MLKNLLIISFFLGVDRWISFQLFQLALFPGNNMKIFLFLNYMNKSYNMNPLLNFFDNPQIDLFQESSCEWLS